MAQADFEELLRQHMGFDAASTGPGLVERAVQERQLSCGVKDRESYFDLVRRSPKELQALVDQVVVPETWFFRDREAFSALVRELTELSRQKPLRQLSLLSMPCASGEEAFSMAMALLDAGVPEQQFAIDAVDISERVLVRARAGLFGNNSFRGGDLQFRDRYFERVESGYRIAPSVQRCVHFQQGNLLEALKLLEGRRYDAIFCRNVLIYLDEAAQRRAQQVLSRLLHDTGQLFVGPAETSVLSGELFVSTRVPLAFAFRKANPQATHVQQAAAPRAARSLETFSEVPRLAAKRAMPLVTTRSAALVSRRLPAAATPNATTPLARLDATAHLEQAAMLADRGLLMEASNLCSEHLRIYGPSAALFYLMALLREAAQDPHEAISLHRKALYLEPHHHEALVHLALLLDKQGDAAGAERLRQRARRLASGERE